MICRFRQRKIRRPRKIMVPNFLLWLHSIWLDRHKLAHSERFLIQFGGILNRLITTLLKEWVFRVSGLLRLPVVLFSISWPGLEPQICVSYPTHLRIYPEHTIHILVSLEEYNLFEWKVYENKIQNQIQIRSTNYNRKIVDYIDYLALYVSACISYQCALSQN